MISVRLLNVYRLTAVLMLSEKNRVGRSVTSGRDRPFQQLHEEVNILCFDYANAEFISCDIARVRKL